jgi:hypothetical protein
VDSTIVPKTAADRVRLIKLFIILKVFSQIICKGKKKNVILQTKTEKIIFFMNSNIELSLLEAEEKQLLDYIWNLVPEQDRKGMTQADVLLVLDLMDDFLAENGLLEESADECTYLEGEIDEIEQLQYVLEKCKEQGVTITSEQVQLIMDGELQFGIEQGYYEEE